MEKIQKKRAAVTAQESTVQHYESLLSELIDNITSLSARIAAADRLAEGELRETRQKAEKKRDICRDELQRHTERLQLMNETLEKLESKIDGLRVAYAESLTTKADEARALAAQRKREAAELVKKADKEAADRERQADQVIRERFDGYNRLSEAEAAEMATNLRAYGKGKNLQLRAEAKILENDAQGILDQIERSQKKERQKLAFHAGSDDVQRIDKQVLGLNLEILA